jgi:hypothetical protein
MGYELLFRAFDLVEKMGAPIAIAAWLTVFLGSIGLGWVLRKHALRPHLVPALALGAISMLAHFSDIAVTLKISPDLALEGNPIWLIVLDRWGLSFAIAYGYTGKFLVGVLNVELYLWYRVTREQVYPAQASSFGEFARRLGERCPRRYGIAWMRIASLFAYLFGYLGLFSFWVAFQNYVGGTNEALYEKVPSPVIVLPIMLLTLAGFYLVETHAAWRRQTGVAPAPGSLG